MKAYERSLLSGADDSTVFDVFGNSVSKEELPELSAIFSSKDSTTDILTPLNYENFSILINADTEMTFELISDAMLSNMQKIEILLYQIFLQGKPTQQDLDALEYLEYFYRLEDQRIDGKISTEEYNQAINSIDTNTMDPIIKMINVQAMHNFICDEFFHAQYRLIDGYNSQCAAIKSSFSQIAVGHEIRSFSSYSDNAAFCYQDALKAIFKVLDIFSKWFNYISEFKNLKKKVAPAYFSDFLKNLTVIDESPFKYKVKKLCKSLERCML